MAKAEFFPPFSTGDVVRYGDADHIVEQAMIDGVNQYRYRTHLASWIPHDQLTFVRKADEESIQRLISADEEDDGSEDDDEYDPTWDSDAA